MVKQQESVVTPARFGQGLTWDDYLRHDEKYRDRYERNYAAFKLTDSEQAALRELMARPNAPARVLVLTEGWCPDCFREVPVAVQMAEAAGMELRVFPRDLNLDIMNEFLRDGEFQSIPTFVFYTKDHRYLMHWSERSAVANEGMVEMRKIFEGRTREEAAPDYEKFQQGPAWRDWQHAAVAELIEKLTPLTG